MFALANGVSKYLCTFIRASIKCSLYIFIFTHFKHIPLGGAQLRSVTVYPFVNSPPGSTGKMGVKTSSARVKGWHYGSKHVLSHNLLEVLGVNSAIAIIPPAYPVHDYFYG